MGDSDDHTLIRILLPKCNETSVDVFLEILISVVSHARLHDNIFVTSLISGMIGEMFAVDADDLTQDWDKLNSTPQQIRQFKLLGFWAVRHYPLMVKKLIGASWKPSRKFNVQVCESMEVSEKQMDDIVSKKMQLRIIELNVCKGTLKKLNHFVRVPMGVGGINASIISTKMTAFDIQSEYLIDCWDALKVGKFSSNFEHQMNLTSTSMPSTVTSYLTTDQRQTIRRSDDPSNAEKRKYKSVRLALSSTCEDSLIPSCSVLLTEIGSNTGNTVQQIEAASEQRSNPTAERNRCVTLNSTAVVPEEANFDVSRAILEMRKDIHNLTKCIGCNTADIESTSTSERFHLVVFKQKDFEISQLMSSIKRLENENNILMEDKKKLIGETEAKSTLISTLEKILNVNSKLQQKMEESSNAVTQELADAVKMKIVLSDKIEFLQKELTAVKSRSTSSDCGLQNEKQDLLTKLSAADKLNCELNVVNSQLRDELEAGKNDSSNMKSKMQESMQKLSAADEANIELARMNRELQTNLKTANRNLSDVESTLQSRIRELIHKSSVTDQINIDLTVTNGKIEQELDATRKHITDTESNLQNQIQGLLHKLSEADKFNMQLTQNNGNLQQELASKFQHELNAMSEAATAKSNLQAQIQELSEKLSAADQLNIQLMQNNGNLQQELASKFQQGVNAMSEAATAKSSLQAQIQELSEKVSAADQLNIRLMQNNGKLEQELAAGKVELKNNEKLTEKFLNLKSRTNGLIGEFNAQIEVIQKENAQLIEHNEQLQEKLNDLKLDAGDDHELLLLSGHMQTDSKEVHVIYDQAELRGGIVPNIGVAGGNHEEKLPESIDRYSIEGDNAQFSEFQIETNSNELPSEPVKTDACITVQSQNDAQNENKMFWQEDFVSEDEIVQKCRPVLQQQKFGWMKFQPYKNSKFSPAFVYPVDQDGVQRAQKIKADGYITDTKSPFWEFHLALELPDEKKQTQIFLLKKFNKKFGANFE